MTNRFSRLVEEDTNETSSKNPERRDKKKLSRLLKKENKTEDDLKKIETLQTKINFYNFGTEENQKKREEEKQVKEKKQKEIEKKKERQREEKEKEERQQRKKEEEERQSRKEERQREWGEERQRQKAGEESDKNKSTVRCIREELNQFDKDIPEDIKTFINNPYNKKEYYKLSLIYHPDKKLFEEDVLKLLSQLLNNHKPSLKFVVDETWQK